MLVKKKAQERDVKGFVSLQIKILEGNLDEVIETLQIDSELCCNEGTGQIIRCLRKRLCSLN